MTAIATTVPKIPREVRSFETKPLVQIDFRLKSALPVPASYRLTATGMRNAMLPAPLKLSDEATFDDAVRAASKRAATIGRTLFEGKVAAAQAVVQAADGAYWITNLGGSLEGPTPSSGTQQAIAFIDGSWARHHVAETLVTAKNDAVKAVVGGTSWVDLRAERSGSPVLLRNYRTRSTVTTTPTLGIAR